MQELFAAAQQFWRRFFPRCFSATRHGRISGLVARSLSARAFVADIVQL
jgi:hypothetical protein